MTEKSEEISIFVPLFCCQVWERFIEICNTNNSLFGITWKSLRAQLDGVELKKTYVLNPLAPEFVPRSFQAESYIRLPPTPSVYQQPMYYPPNQGGASQGSSYLHMRPPPPVQTSNQWLPGWNSKVKSSSSKESSIASPLGSTDDFQRHLGLSNSRVTSQIGMPQGRSLSPSIDFTNPNTFLRPPPNMLNSLHLLEPQLNRRIPSQLDKDMQFLQNVHFPSPVHNEPSSKLDMQHLLPHNISLNELVNSPNKQYEWFIHLVDTAGIETANKFFEFITSSSLTSSSNVTPVSPVSLLQKSYVSHPSQQLLSTQQQLNNLDLLHKQRLVPNATSPQNSNSYLINSQLMNGGMDVLESLLNTGTAQPSLQQRPHTWYAQSTPNQTLLQQNTSRLLANTSLNNLASSTRLDDLKNYSIRDIEAVLLLDQQANRTENGVGLHENGWEQNSLGSPYAMYKRLEDTNPVLNKLDQQQLLNSELLRPSQDMNLVQHQQMQLLQQKYKQDLQQQQQQNDEQKQHQQYLLNSEIQRLQQQQHNLQQLHQQQQQQLAQQQLQQQQREEYMRQVNATSSGYSLQHSLSSPNMMAASQPLNYSTPVFVNSNGGPAANPLQHSSSNFPPQSQHPQLMQGPPVNKLMNGHLEHSLSQQQISQQQQINQQISQQQLAHQQQQQQQKQMMPQQPQKPLTYASVLRQTQVEAPRKQEMQPAPHGKMKPGVSLGQNPLGGASSGGDPFAVFRDLGNKQTGLYQYFS